MQYKSEEILKIENLSFSYNHNTTDVLDGINIDIKKGSFISILGPNGSGKSTLVNLISKVLKGYRGTIRIFGRDIKKLGSREAAKLIAVVPQYNTPGFDYTVRDMVLMGRYPYISRFGSEKRRDFEFSERIMEVTRVLKFAGKKFSELSGGEKQRVIIAQALLQDTPLLLLDEPTSHLDINFQIELMDLFYRLNENEGKTIMGIFHDINLAASYSETAVFLKEGKVYCAGPVEKTVTRDNIRSVFKSDAYVGKNPFTGKLYISPVFGTGFENKNLKGYYNKRIHVIGGGGAASPILNMLSNMGYSVSCGVINNFDSDIDTAGMLGIPFVSEAPFSPISLFSQNKNLEFIKASDVVILPEIAFGHGNFSNLVSVKEAVEMGKKVIVVDSKKIMDRDYADGKAARLYGKILEKGAITVDSIRKIPEKL